MLKRFEIGLVAAMTMAALAPVGSAHAQGAAPMTVREAPGLPVQEVQGCGWYVVLGCHRSFNSANRQRARLGGPAAGGGAGLNVIDTSDYPNFRNGYQCVMDGPYGSRGTARSIAWNEAVPDAYVKSAC